MELHCITDTDVRGKRLLVRADLNVPVVGQQVTDSTRIKRFAVGMRQLIQKGARLVILTHFGRPDPNQRDPFFSVDKLCAALSEMLGVPVKFSNQCVGRAVISQTEQLADGEAMLCENLRYHKGEVENDIDFAAELAKLGDIYVNDAFSCAHRSHASTDAITRLLPSVAGPLLVEEVEALSSALEAPKSPAVAIVGGAKVSTKIAVLRNLVEKLDVVIIGGGMANTFLFSDGAPMGKSLYEADQVETVTEIRALAAKANCRLVLPIDSACTTDFAKGAERHVFNSDACPDDMMILDAGPESVAQFEKVVANSKTILWNGPLGAFEILPFDNATMALACCVANVTTNSDVVSVAGGGDTVAALNAADVTGKFTYVSSAGGAFLEWLEGKELPGIAALQKAIKPT